MTTSKTSRLVGTLIQTIKFGQNRINKFCSDNSIMAVIRSHEPIQGGWSQTGNIITVFSCTDYCGQGNDAAIVLIKRNDEIAPKVMPNVAGRKEQRWLMLDQAKKSTLPE
jgi:hypothetical protein